MKKIIILFIISSQITACFSSKFSIHERREGFTNSTLRVFVRNTVLDDVDMDKTFTDSPAVLNDLADKRAILLIFSYINSNSPEFTQYSELDSEIKSSLATRKNLHSYCEENYCEGFFEYDVSHVLLKLREKWNIPN